MKYQEFLDYIYQRHSGNVKLGLDRINNILKEMNYPNLALKGIHIAGTNGKGSTAAMCEAMSLQYYLKTGLNTSPHLVDYRERIRLDGENINLKELINIYKKWGPVFEKHEASFFEITTAMAFNYFQANNVENAIFEVGLGGRLDGTNPFAATVSVITTISFDHTKSLGDTIEKIAYEKAGIIKENTPVVLGQMNRTSVEVIKKIAREKNAQVYEFGKDFEISDIHIDPNGSAFNYHDPQIELPGLTINLLGKHQPYNAAAAIKAFSLFLQKTGKPFDETKIRKALININWPGRMQIISKDPTVIIDGAHNEEGMRVLINNLEVLFPDKKIFFVLAILRDKNLEQIIRDVCSISYKIFISKNKSTRAAEIEDQLNIAKKHHTNFETVMNVVDAAKQAISEADKEDIVIISGSLYTISEVLKEKEKLHLRLTQSKKIDK
ncbi:MAG: bifunctional folylpolyglutamate synthase/dihydrofolate synthase [Candidatus Cloacimonetes bacterium]|nr:bifunctional folylpolyglutamate synthase/dihydrofolate synthase [Candidatus Cloacimonadota bacterium]